MFNIVHDSSDHENDIHTQNVCNDISEDDENDVANEANDVSTMSNDVDVLFEESIDENEDASLFQDDDSYIQENINNADVEYQVKS